MVSTDTSLLSREKALAAFAAMSGAERLAHACEMAEEAKVIALAGIRSRRPELDDAGVHRVWLAMLHGEKLASRLA